MVQQQKYFLASPAVLVFQKFFPGGLPAAIKEAKALSYSLGESYLPNDREGFEALVNGAEPWVDDCDGDRFAATRHGVPKCQISDTTAIGEVLKYSTYSRNTQFLWVVKDNLAMVVLHTSNLRESNAYRSFMHKGFGWEASFCYQQDQQASA